MDAPGVALTLGIVNTAIDAAKKAVGMAKELNSIDLKQQVSEVFDAVLDLKLRLIDLQEENGSLKAKLEARESIIFDPPSGFFFRRGESEPLCPTCYQSKEHLAVYLSTSQDGVSYCKICRNSST